MTEWYDLVTKYTGDLTRKDSYHLIHAYVTAIKTGDDHAEILMSSKIWALFAETEYNTPEHYDALLSPILHAEETDSRNEFVLNRSAVAYALRNLDCPAYLLAAACHQTASPAYAVIASMNPKCPVGDAVYAALLYG